MTDKKDEALKLALEALEETLQTLDDENAKPGGAIADTIWYSEHETLFDYLAAQITAIREALAEQPAQHQGWKLVPVEPTPEMLKAADDGDDEYTRRNFGPAVHRVMQGPYDHYIAMLNAAPQPAQQQEPVAWMFQHEETGRTMCVDAQQVEWGFEKGNPRLKKIAPLYTSPPASKPLADEEMRTEFESWVVHTFGMEFNQFEKSSDGTYLRGLVREYWGCWKAAHGIKGDA